METLLPSEAQSSPERQVCSLLWPELCSECGTVPGSVFSSCRCEPDSNGPFHSKEGPVVGGEVGRGDAAKCCRSGVTWNVLAIYVYPGEEQLLSGTWLWGLPGRWKRLQNSPAQPFPCPSPVRGKPSALEANSL